LRGAHLSQIEYQHPFYQSYGPNFIAGDSFVENTTGTRFSLHVAPGHGLEDYALGVGTRAADLFAGG